MAPVQLITPPEFVNDSEKTRAAQLLQAAINVFLVVSLVYLLVGMTQLLPSRSPIPVAALSLVMLTGLLVLLRAGRIQLTGVLLAIIIWGVTVILNLTTGGLTTPSFSGYILLIFIAGFLVSQRAGLIFTGLSLLTIFLVFEAEMTGLIGTALGQPQREFFAHGTYLITVAAVLVAVKGRLNRILKDLDQAREDLTQRNWVLQAEIERRQKAEASLRETEARFRVTLTDSPVIVFNHDRDLRYTWIHNPTPDLTPSALLGKTDREVLANQQEAAALMALKRKALDGNQRVREVIGLQVNGSFAYYDLHIDPLHDEHGSVVGIACATFDVTELKQAQDDLARARDESARHNFRLRQEVENHRRTAAALRESDARFRVALTGSPIIVFNHDTELRYTWVYNPAPGFSPDALLGRTDAELMTHLDEAAYLMAVKRRALESGQSVRELVELHLNGERVVYDLYVEPLRDEQGQISGLTCTTFDVTEVKQVQQALRREIEERQRTEAALRESEARFRVALTGSPIIVFNHDTELRYTWIYNPVSGFSPDVLLGRTDAELMTHPDEAAKLMAVKRRVLESGQSARDLVELHLNDKRLVYDLYVEPLRDEQGQISGLTCTTFDVTELKQAQEALAEAKDELAEYNTHLRREIDERQRAEVALAESEARWRFALEGSGAGVWDHDFLTKRTFRTRQWNELMGLDAPDDYGDVASQLSRVQPDDASVAMDLANRHISGEIPFFQTQYRVLQPDGSYRWLLDRGKIVARTPDGLPARMVGTVTDITDRKQMEDQLRASEAAYREMFEANPHPMWIYDRETLGFLAVNRAAVEKYGYTSDEFRNMSIRDIRPPEDLARLENVLQMKAQARATFAKSGTWTHLKRNGEILLVEIVAHNITFEGRPGVMVVAYDLTARIQAEAALRRSKDLFEKIFDNVPVSIAILSMQEQRVLNVNSHFVQTMGYQPDEVLGKQIGELGIWQHYDDTDEIIQAIRAEGHVYHRERQWRAKSGELLDMLVSVEQVMIDDQACLLGIGVNLTERKRTEQERLEAQNVLNELRQQREYLALKERFVSRMSHEFRNPLTVIRSSSETLKAYYDRMSPEKRLEVFKRIDGQVLRLIDMLDDILAMSRAQSERKAYNPVTVDIGEYAQVLVDQIRAMDTRSHVLSLQVGENMEGAQLDTRLTDYILFNLLNNALKYSPEGSEVLLSIERAGDHLRFAIRDHGIGIPTEEQERLWEPFFRASNARSVQGTGLGLAIVKETVEICGGTISCESQPNVGTTFTVMLPFSGNRS